MQLTSLVNKAHAEFYKVTVEVIDYFLESATEEQIKLLFLYPDKPHEEIEAASELIDQYCQGLALLKAIPMAMTDHSPQPNQAEE